MPPKPPLDARLLAYARRMRREPTDAEAKLWQFLRNRRLGGYKFRRQVPIAGYIVDFYCHEAALGIELDGGQHNVYEDKAYDDGRSLALDRAGVRIVRFWNAEVLRNTEGVLEEILGYLSDLTLRPPSP